MASSWCFTSRDESENSFIDLVETEEERSKRGVWAKKNCCRYWELPFHSAIDDTSSRAEHISAKCQKQFEAKQAAGEFKKICPKCGTNDRRHERECQHCVYCLQPDHSDWHTCKHISCWTCGKFGHIAEAHCVACDCLRYKRTGRGLSRWHYHYWYSE